MVSSAMGKCAEYNDSDLESVMSKKNPSASHRPRALTVFAAAFAAGAVAAVGINRTLDIHLAQAKPQVECEPIFVALRDLPQGAPVTVFDVALQEWPKAMMPSTALRAKDRFDGMLMKQPIREGQPLLAGQLVEGTITAQFDNKNIPSETYEAPVFQPASATDTDSNLWVAQSSTISVEENTQLLSSNINQTAGIEDQEVQESSAIEDSALAAVSSEPNVSGNPLTEKSEPVLQNVDQESLGVSTTIIRDEKLTQESILNTSVPEPVISTPSITEMVEMVEMAELPPPASPNRNAEHAMEKTSESTPVQTTTVSPKRYLVVPERIAVQAERSFTSEVPQNQTPQSVEQQMALKSQNNATTLPQAQRTTAPEAQQPKPSLQEATNVTVPPSTQVTTLPENQQQGMKALENSSGRTSSRKQYSRPASIPRVSQAPTLENHPNREQQKAPSVFRGLFPNIRATVGAVEEELQKIRQERSVSNQQQSIATQAPTAEDKNQSNSSTKSARWPWSFGR